MQVYKLPLKALDNIPTESTFGVSMLGWSVAPLAESGKPWCEKLAEDSAYAAISFPVCPFHTWILPSQEATLPLVDNMQIAFTT